VEAFVNYSTAALFRSPSFQPDVQLMVFYAGVRCCCQWSAYFPFTITGDFYIYEFSPCKSSFLGLHQLVYSYARFSIIKYF